MGGFEKDLRGVGVVRNAAGARRDARELRWRRELMAGWLKVELARRVMAPTDVGGAERHGRASRPWHE